MTLRFGEYRESTDIRFFVSHGPGYRDLREMISGPLRFNALTRSGQRLTELRAPQTNQYGIYTLIEVEGVPLKLEIVLEGRITLNPPALDDQVCGIASLTPLDLATSKLLANADRWADDAAHNRDLIDLAMMQPGKELLASAMAKAEVMYGYSVRRSLSEAAEHLMKRAGRLEHNMRVMQMTVPRALVLQRIRNLMRRLPPSPTGTATAAPGAT